MEEKQLIHLVKMRIYHYDTPSFHSQKNVNEVAAGSGEITRELEASG